MHFRHPFILNALRIRDWRRPRQRAGVRSCTNITIVDCFRKLDGVNSLKSPMMPARRIFLRARIFNAVVSRKSRMRLERTQGVEFSCTGNVVRRQIFNAFRTWGKGKRK